MVGARVTAIVSCAILLLVSAGQPVQGKEVGPEITDVDLELLYELFQPNSNEANYQATENFSHGYLSNLLDQIDRNSEYLSKRAKPKSDATSRLIKYRQFLRKYGPKFKKQAGMNKNAAYVVAARDMDEQKRGIEKLRIGKRSPETV